MLDIKAIVSDADTVKKSLTLRGQPELGEKIDELSSLDSKRKKLIQEVEVLKAKRNEASQQIGKLKKEKKDASEIMSQMKGVSDQIKGLDEEQSKIETAMRAELLVLPNVLQESVPEGLAEDKNREERVVGEKPALGFKPLSHYEIGEKAGILDFKKAGDVTGARFAFLKGQAAELERALIRFMLKTHKEKGYEEILPPFIVNYSSLEGTGNFPKFTEDVFKLEGFEYYLIPTAEVPVTNYHRGEILPESELPKRYMAYTPCFRSEAGSYGKDTKGLKRQHQFNKVELVKFVAPESSNEELEKLTSDAEDILKKLELPYRVMTLCAGDTSFSSSKTYDIEVWSPFSETYMEISSCSNFLDFQARRANIRYRDGNKKVRHVHTLNGSGLAVGRTLIAILENYQTEEGGFEIPAALKPFLD